MREPGRSRQRGCTIRRFVCLPLVALAGAVMLAHAAAAEPAEDCTAGRTTRDIDQCYHRIYQRADAELNRVYRQLIDRLSDPSERELLRLAEQVWIQYRDKQCAFETAGTRNGTIHPIEVSHCLTAKTQTHIEELHLQQTCPEGDPTCMHELRGSR